MIVGIFIGLVLAIPIILPPVLFVWYLNASGIRNVIKQMRTSRMPQSQQR